MESSVLHGDCLEMMATLPDNSVDLICTDPPYFKVKADWWDRQWEKPHHFLEWLDKLAEQWQRILKPNGSLYCFASPKMSARVEVMLDERFNILNNIVWDKRWESGHVQRSQRKEDARCFATGTERIIFCEHYGADNVAKGEAGYGAKCDELKGFVFEPLRNWFVSEWQKSGLSRRQVDSAANCSNCTQYWFLERDYQIPTPGKYEILQQLAPGYFTRPYEELRQQYEELRQQYEELRRPFNVSADVPYTDVWIFPTVQAYPGKHPCEKPAPMLEHIITASTRPDAVVLDCFAGSGATLVAAQKLGRTPIGIEIDPHWASVCRQKLGDFSSTGPSLEERVTWLETQVKALRRQKHKPDTGQLALF